MTGATTLALAVAFAVAAGCGHGTTTKTPSDANETLQQCEATFESAVPRACGSAADCALFDHPDCCGDVEIGVAASGVAAATAAESAYTTCVADSCGGRGCDHATEAQDGMVPNAGQSIVPVCIAQLCASTVQ